MALRGDQRSHLVHRQRDPLLACVRTHIRYKIGCTYSGHLLSQHLSTWDEWTSPSELIHPGDQPRISSITSNQTKPPYGRCIRNDIRVVNRDLAPHIAQADGRESPSGQPPIGLPQRLSTRAPHQRRATPSVWKQMTGGTALHDEYC
jgi:hypothetical protein